MKAFKARLGRESAFVAVAGCLFIATGSAARADVASQPAGEQRAPDTEASSRTGDIIVTARKREESILKVPVVTSVLMQAQLENY